MVGYDASMVHHVIPVDDANFESAELIAVNNSWRLWCSDESLSDVLPRWGLDPAIVHRERARLGEGRVVIIERGLMRGVYTTSPHGDTKLHVSHDGRIEPLRNFGGGREFDIALCHAFTRAGETPLVSIEQLASELEAANLSVFRISPAALPNDPVWGVRYREAVYHSEYFVPVMEESFLEHDGAVAELVELCVLDEQLGSNTFLHPIVPLLAGVPAVEVQSAPVPELFVQRRTRSPLHGLRERTLWLAADDGLETVTEFLSSLVKNARGLRDLGFLTALGQRFEGFERTRLDGSPAVRAYVRDAGAESVADLIVSGSVCRVAGRGVPSNDARRESPSVAAVDAYLCSGPPVPWTTPARALLDGNGVGPADSYMYHFVLGKQFLQRGRDAQARRHFESAIERGDASGDAHARLARCAGASASPVLERSANGESYDLTSCRFEPLPESALAILRPYLGIGASTKSAGMADFERVAAIAAAEGAIDDAIAALAASVNFSVSLESRSRLLRQGAALLRKHGRSSGGADWLRWAKVCDDGGLGL